MIAAKKKKRRKKLIACGKALECYIYGGLEVQNAMANKTRNTIGASSPLIKLSGKIFSSNLNNFL